MPDRTVFQSQLEDREVLAELEETGIVDDLASEIPMAVTETVGGGVGNTGVTTREATQRLRTAETPLAMPDINEAIVMRHGYPALLIQNGDYEQPRLRTWQKRLNPNRSTIKRVIGSVGRVDLRNLPAAKWVGTCWLIDEDTLITNRHVADFFTDVQNGRVEILPGVEVYADFLEEHGSDEQLEYLIRSVSYIEADPRIDLAFMKLDSGVASRLGIEPIPVAETHDESEFIGVVGYPARDHRNPVHDQARIFRDIFDVKRLAPGKIMDANHDSYVFTHNCTTLGGNSGSAVFDIQSGKAVGLHFAGSALEQNYAVKARWVLDRLARFGRGPSHFSNGTATRREGDERRDSFADRDGYRADFIGDGRLSVPMPRLNAAQQRDVVRLRDGGHVLDYRHFSVVMSKRRRLAYFAAANVDGDELRRPRRRGFKTDPRIRDSEQADNDLYRNNPLDRGHLIRRLDPCWGTREQAEQANADSMFYTNIAPQHKDLNQKIWLDLEEHILSNTDRENAKVSVFVGCLFDEDDPKHRDTGIKVPMGFWKIVASASRERRGRSRFRKLEAQAFVLFQNHLVTPSDLELRFGGVPGVQQITVEELERLTGLDFTVLRDADTFGLDPDVRESVAHESNADPVIGSDSHYRSIQSVDDIVFG
ncbi:MAG: DNA/RNA non-specific endonuclease [Planctomycetota bacterium]